MTKSLFLLLPAFILSACSSNIEDAKKVLEESLVIKTDLEFNELESYPGNVVCGLYSAYVSYHEAKKEDAPFLVIDGNLNTTPTDLDLDIFCSPEPSAALYEAIGIGPVTNRSTELLKIIRDFSTLSNALENYHQDTYEFPSESEGLDALVTKPTGVRYRGQYREGGYLQEIPTDPWGRPYQYSHTRWAGVKGNFELITQGRSGEPGGAALEADVNSKYLTYLEHVASIQAPK